MSVIKSLVACGMFAATLWSTTETQAGGGCHRTYSRPVYHAPIVHVHHHGGGPGGPGFDDDHGGGPGGGGPGGGGQGLGGPGGQGGQGGGGQGGQQGIGGQNGQGQNGQNQNGQGQNGQGQNGQNQNGQNQNGNNQNGNNQNGNNQNGQNQNGQNQNGQNQNGNNQNGQNQNGQNQVVQNQNGQNQNQNQNVAAVEAVKVPSGSQVTLTGDYGTDGEVYLNINNVKLPLVVEQWTNTGITLTLPAVKLTQAQSATIDVVAKGGKTDSIAITLNPQAKLVVNNGQTQPANQDGGGNAGAGNVAGVQ